MVLQKSMSYPLTILLNTQHKPIQVLLLNTTPRIYLLSLAHLSRALTPNLVMKFWDQMMAIVRLQRL